MRTAPNYGVARSTTAEALTLLAPLKKPLPPSLRRPACENPLAVPFPGHDPLDTLARPSASPSVAKKADGADASENECGRFRDGGQGQHTGRFGESPSP
jgi:hypothetical protein